MLFGGNELYKHVSLARKEQKREGKGWQCRTYLIVLHGKVPSGLLQLFSTSGLSYIMNTSNMDKSHYDFLKYQVLPKGSTLDCIIAGAFQLLTLLFKNRALWNGSPSSFHCHFGSAYNQLISSLLILVKVFDATLAGPRYWQVPGMLALIRIFFFFYYSPFFLYIHEIGFKSLRPLRRTFSSTNPL